VGVIAKLRVGISSIPESFGVIAVQPERLVVIADGAPRVSLVRKHRSTIVVQIGARRVKLNAAIESSDRQVVLMGISERYPLLILGIGCWKTFRRYIRGRWKHRSTARGLIFVSSFGRNGRRSN